MQRIRRFAIAAWVCLFAIVLSSILATGTANAAAYTKDVYAPQQNGTTVTGWANLSRDCSGTFGCWNYMKIERHRAWGQEFVSGSWVSNNGWNSVSASLPGGCYNYRTVVDSYNDALASAGIGANVGPVGVSASGEKIYRFLRTWSSGETRICR